jgi:ABC-2 type transport system ATP-binding protein
MVHRPPILILDEPTAGVDVALRQSLWKEVRKLNDAGVTIILTTHYLEEAEAMCDTLAIVNKGQVVAEGQTSEMLSKLDKKELIISLKNDDADKIKLHGIHLTVMNKSLIKISFKPSEINEGEIIEKIYNSGAKIKTINSKEPDLEDLFLEITNEN